MRNTKDDNPKVVATGDGSPTLFSDRFNAHYHSIHGAISESQHVFILNGLEYFLEKNNRSSIDILELGFGTGLNALLTCQYLKAVAIVTTAPMRGSPFQIIQLKHTSQTLCFLMNL